ncbi:MAG: triose-phosphate isomerase, partial [Pseudomonadota bacterium]
MVRTLIAGNWKMNGLKSSLSETDKVVSALADYPDTADCLICPPSTLIVPMKDRAGDRLKVGAQSCHPEKFGAFTGDLSAEQLRDAGASYVIVEPDIAADQAVHRLARRQIAEDIFNR